MNSPRTLLGWSGPRPASDGRSVVHRVLAGLVLVAAALALAAAPALGELPAEEAAPPADSLAATHTITAYYFYTNMRCNSCRRIEAWSQAAIEGAFGAELASGRLVWRPVNLDDKGNQHFVDDYELYTKSLIVVEEIGGKQVRWKNLTKVWELLSNMTAFHTYVQKEVRAYLDPVP